MALQRKIVFGLALLSLLYCSAAGKSVLVLTQEKSADKYSSFIESLTAAGFAVDVKQYKEAGLKLREYGAWHYDSLALLAPKAESKATEPLLQGLNINHV